MIGFVLSGLILLASPLRRRRDLPSGRLDTRL